MRFLSPYGRPLGSRTAIGLLAVVMSAAVLPALAADEAAAPVAGHDPWIVSIGVMATVDPKWIGDSRYGLGGLPSISFRRASQPEGFSAPDDSLDLALYDNDRLRFGPIASLRSGRSQQGGVLAGIDEYPWTVEAGAFVEFWPVEDHLRLRAELRHGLRADDGFVGDLMADLVQRYGQLTLSGGPRLVLADANVMGVEFGVSPAASLRSGLSAYDPKGGIVSAGLSAAQSYAWSEQWTTTLYQRYDYLLKEAADSPIVQAAGSRNQFTFGFGVTYSFMVD